MPRSNMPIVIHAKAADPKIWELLSKGGASSPAWTRGGAAPPRNLEVETGCRHERPRRALCGLGPVDRAENPRSEEHTSELPSLMRTSYAAFCLKTKIQKKSNH